MAVYWSGYDFYSDIAFWSSSSFWWQRWSSTWPTINLFPTNGTINFLQSIQLALGDCYYIASMASVAEYPSIIKNILLTQTKNSAAVYAVIFNIRGKPWTIAVDDYLLMYN